MAKEVRHCFPAQAHQLHHQPTFPEKLRGMHWARGWEAALSWREQPKTGTVVFPSTLASGPTHFGHGGQGTVRAGWVRGSFLKRRTTFQAQGISAQHYLPPQRRTVDPWRKDRGPPSITRGGGREKEKAGLSEPETDISPSKRTRSLVPIHGQTWRPPRETVC